MKRIEVSILAAILFSLVLSMCTINTECREIRSSILRLHVLANSDSTEDQELKLKVRDRLLEMSETTYSQAKTKQDAVQATQASLDMLRNEAANVIQSNGYSYPVSVSLETCYFNTRTYGNITLPAGNYQALRVVIGKGQGHNWWCVMLPPLCVSAASETEAELKDVLSREQLELVEGDGYEIKFKCVEMYEELKQYLSRES